MLDRICLVCCYNIWMENNQYCSFAVQLLRAACGFLRGNAQRNKPMITLIPVRASRYPLYKKVLVTLLTLTHSRMNGPLLPPQDTWATTRQVSDVLDISIYQTRLILLDLVKYNLVIVSDRRLNKSLRWYPHASAYNLRPQPQQGTPQN